MSMPLTANRIWFPLGVSLDGKYGDIGSAENDTVLSHIPIECIGAICLQHNRAIFDMQEEAWEREDRLRVIR